MVAVANPVATEEADLALAEIPDVSLGFVDGRVSLAELDRDVDLSEGEA